MKIPAKIIYSVLAAVAILAGCAHRQTPTGGPDDKTGPAVKSINPASEAVNVPLDTRITITFAEWLLPSSEKGISLFPATPVKARVTGNRLEIRPLKRLNDSTTYHLVITSGLKDLRNNPISKPLNIIFSTGPSLDSGKIAGCVADPARKLLQPAVALFRAPWQPEDSGFCGPPDYFTQTDSTGIFAFEHVRTGTYRLLAYLDKNSDARLQSGEELYLPTDSIVTIAAASTRAVLYPSLFDTTRQTIASVKTIDNRTIIGDWKKPWDSLTCPAAPVFRLEPIDTLKKSVAARTRSFPGVTRFFLLPEKPLDSTAYRLIYSLKSIFDTAAVVDTLRVDGAARPDTSAPSLVKTLPEKRLDLKPDLRLLWSEPVYPAATLTMADSLGDTLGITATDTAANDTSRYSIPRSLLPGRDYRIVLLTSGGSDLSGNPLRSRDSTDTAAVITLTTVKADSLAVSVSGAPACLEKDAARRWMFKPFSGERTYTCADKAGAFRFDSIPSCKGSVGTFIDRNGNDRPDIGRLLPFVAPEPFIMFGDTVEARARWDVEGVELAPCDPCERKKPEAADSSGVAEDTLK